nr:glycosyltransferase [uncultured Anaerotignum sp.]
MNSKKLLFITTRIFWPATSGRKVSLYYYCKGLHEEYGYDIYLYSFLEADQSPEQSECTMPDFIKEVRFAAPIGKTEILFNLLTRSMSTHQWPLQCSLFYSKSNNERIQQYIAEQKFDVVITDMIRTAPYISAFKDVECTKILDMDDLLSKRYERTLNSAISGDNFLGQYSKFMPGFVNQKIVPLAKNLALKMEIKRLHKAEVGYSEQYDHIIFVSDIETEDLNKKLSAPKCTTVTLGVDYAYYSEDISFSPKDNTISFIGNFGYTPNVDSLQLITTHVLPKLDGQTKLIAVGKVPNDVINKYQTDRIEFTGAVDDLRPYIKQSNVFLAPIAYGSGIKTKILEAMAMGVPVVTNSIGAEGISAKNGTDFFVTDDFSEMAKIVSTLIQDKEKSKQIGHSGANYVKEHHQWNDIIAKFEEIGITGNKETISDYN